MAPPLGMAAWGLKPIVAVVTATAAVVPSTTLVFVMDPAASATGDGLPTRHRRRRASGMTLETDIHDFIKSLYLVPFTSGNLGNSRSCRGWVPGFMTASPESFGGLHHRCGNW